MNDYFNKLEPSNKCSGLEQVCCSVNEAIYERSSNERLLNAVKTFETTFRKPADSKLQAEI
jgi:hypothetical protein